SIKMNLVIKNITENIMDYVLANNNTQLANDGEFITIESTLSDAIEKNVSSTFNYYIENNKLMICTYQEAAKKWQEWWSKNANTIK
ncbi:hypothetical protein, partial [Chryseobacterium luteum]|uniref:hypothetical protein n=1 Tax=Chryseobacterium luteum TaxID=421531 RepID=UPI00054DB030